MLFHKRHHTIVAVLVFSTLLAAAAPFSSLARADDKPLEQCQTLLQEAQSSDKATHWTSPAHNIFSDTLPLTLVSTVAWLSTVETIRQVGFHDHPAVTSTFLRTVPIDATLSTISHAIALGHLPWLKKFLSAEGLPRSVEFWARTGANGLISTAVISTAWTMSGISFTGEHLLGAFTLCAGVYPTLQKLKSYLFKVFPFQKDRDFEHQLQTRLPEEMGALGTTSEQRAEELGLHDSEIEALFLSSLEALITSKPYETSIDSIDALRNKPKLRRLTQQLNDLDESQIENQTKKMKLRRKLLNELLSLEEQPNTPSEVRDQIAQLLNLGTPFTDTSSLEFHRVFRDRYATYRTRIIVASFLDQAFAVGLAGGVFLYSTTFWAAHGQWPW